MVVLLLVEHEPADMRCFTRMCPTVEEAQLRANIAQGTQWHQRKALDGFTDRGWPDPSVWSELAQDSAPLTPRSTTHTAAVAWARQ